MVTKNQGSVQDLSDRGVAVLVVNGKTGHGRQSWLDICLPRILGFASGLLPLKVLVWNHDFENMALAARLEAYGDRIDVMDERDPAFSAYDGPRYPPRSTLAFHEFHVHRTPLQLLYERAMERYGPAAIYVCDSDAWPVRPGWDVRMMSSLEEGHKLVGVWRDEMTSVIQPFIHASGMAFPADLVEQLKLRLDYKPEHDGEDTLSNFTRAVQARFGSAAIEPLERSNAHAFHGVFGGVYGDWVYHHHLGTRWSDGQTPTVKTKGWEDRREDLDANRRVMAETVARAFDDPDRLVTHLRFGDRATEGSRNAASSNSESPSAATPSKLSSPEATSLQALEAAFDAAQSSQAYWQALADVSAELGRDADARAFRLACDLAKGST